MRETFSPEGTETFSQGGTFHRRGATSGTPMAMTAHRPRMADDMMVGMKAIDTRNAQIPNLSEGRSNIDQFLSQLPDVAS